MINQVFLIGRIASNLVVKKTKKNNHDYLFFTIANELQGNMQETPLVSFISCVAFRGTALRIANCQKGDLLFINGTIRATSFEKEGIRHFSTNVNVVSVSVIQKNTSQIAKKEDFLDTDSNRLELDNQR
jgi:single-stranded DNA-binding protein